MRTIQRNKPIATVIRHYMDKKSGRVTASRDEIQRRFFGLDWKDQKRILCAFLNAGKADREWAYSRLLDWWDEAFESKVLELWEMYHERKCAWVIIRHFPAAFLKEHVNTFSDGRDYYIICRRLASETDFVIDKNRLSHTDYLMVMAHGGLHINEAEANDILYAIVQELCFHWCPTLEVNRTYVPMRTDVMAATDFRPVSIALYYLMKLGHDHVIEAFLAWANIVKMTVRHSADYQTLAQEVLSDHEYTRKLAVIMQRHLYSALPAKYKTMTDEEYQSRSGGEGFVGGEESPTSQEAWVQEWLESLV